MRHFIVVAMIAAGLSLPGCYVPPVWDMADAIHKVDQVEEGTTTREEVLKLLGEPKWKEKSVFRGGEYVFRYFGSTSAGGVMLGWGKGLLLYEENWWIDVAFDENGVVQVVSTSIDELKAEQGNADAQYKLALSTNDSTVRRWWACLAANQGHPDALVSLGDFENDPQKTYMWYSLAVSHGHPTASQLKDEFTKKLTPEQIAEAERLVEELVEEWGPNSTLCGVEEEQQRRKAAAACEIPFAQSVELDANMQTVLYKRCRLILPSSSATNWMWTCLAANHGHAEAQHEMGKFYENGRDLVSQDLILAYAWYSLAKVNGFEESGANYRKTATGWDCCFPDRTRREILAEELGLAQAAEAERLVAEWQPNPAQCGTVAAQSKN